MKNCSYQFYTESHHPSRAERLSSDIILLILSKLYGNLVSLQITDFIERKQVYNKCQSGYRKNHSTRTILSKLYDDIRLAMKRSEVNMIVVTDYSKAFDTIDFYTLLQKMHSLNFSTGFLYWVF